jgi:hypothetical protein
LLLQTNGPLLAWGTLAHLRQNERALIGSAAALVEVLAYEDADHGVVINGYIDGFDPRLLYCDRPTLTVNS